MITRIVNLVIDEAKVDDFISLFHTNKKHILGSGCHDVSLLRDVVEQNKFVTYSKWPSEVVLNAYRKSEIFGKIWPKTKSMLIEKPRAHSYTIQESQ